MSHNFHLVLYLSTFLHITSSLECYDLAKCTAKDKYRTTICKTSSAQNCVYTRNSVNCPRMKGSSSSCNPDWFHGSCECKPIGNRTEIRGEERCYCKLDKNSVGIVAGVLSVALVAISTAFFFWSRWGKMKKLAQSARVENRVLNQVLENKAAAEREKSEGEAPNQFVTGNVYVSGSGLEEGRTPGENESGTVLASAPPQPPLLPPTDKAVDDSTPGKDIHNDELLDDEDIYVDVDYDNGAVGASIV